MGEYNILEAVKIQVKQYIRRGFKKWGIERTEDKIKYHYHFRPKALNFMIKCYKEILKGE